MIDLFEEFFKIITKFNKENIRYAVVGGIAMAFHVEPRFTKDIDLLVMPEELTDVRNALLKLNYFESSDPWTFKNTDLTLHRFMRTEGEDFLTLDILVGHEPEHRKIISEVIFDDSKAGTVPLAKKEHLIWMKKARNSDQDQVDMRRLQNDED